MSAKVRDYNNAVSSWWVHWYDYAEESNAVVATEVGLVMVRILHLWERTTLYCQIGARIHERVYERCWSQRYSITLAKRWARELAESLQ